MRRISTSAARTDASGVWSPRAARANMAGITPRWTVSSTAGVT